MRILKALVPIAIAFPLASSAQNIPGESKVGSEHMPTVNDASIPIKVNDPNIAEVRDEQIAATTSRGFMRILRVSALVGDRGYPSVIEEVKKVNADTASVKITVYSGAGSSRHPAELIVPIEWQLQNAGLDPATAKIIAEDKAVGNDEMSFQQFYGHQDSQSQVRRSRKLELSSKAYFVCALIREGVSRENDHLDYERLNSPQLSIYDPSNLNKMHFGNKDVDIFLTVGSDKGKEFVLLIKIVDKISHKVSSIVTENVAVIPDHENLIVACHDEA